MILKTQKYNLKSKFFLTGVCTDVRVTDNDTPSGVNSLGKNGQRKGVVCPKKHQTDQLYTDGYMFVLIAIQMSVLVWNRLQNHAYYGDEAFAGDSVGLGLGQ